MASDSLVLWIIQYWRTKSGSSWFDAGVIEQESPNKYRRSHRKNLQATYISTENIKLIKSLTVITSAIRPDVCRAIGQAMCGMNSTAHEFRQMEMVFFHGFSNYCNGFDLWNWPCFFFSGIYSHSYDTTWDSLTSSSMLVGHTIALHFAQTLRDFETSFPI